ncbi:MAG: Cys-tRNA(Pro) deacylase [Clostridia bacterium]|nr:Cys-tRNA(Pro) deacylase [Clostridia bacterium]
MQKTNAIRLLEKAKIPFETKEYEVDESDLSGTHVAECVNLPPEIVFKTLVARGDKNGLCVFCIPCAEELDLKKAAKVSGNKKIEMLPLKELLPTTGYIRGGCSPVGMKKKLPTFVHSTAVNYEKFAVSGGARGIQLFLSPKDLISFVGASCEDIIKD